MRKGAIIVAAIALALASCSGDPAGDVIHRGRNGRPDQWIYRMGHGKYKISFDTNGDGHPDTIKTYENNQLIEVETDRSHSGQTDLVQEYSNGVLVREIHDDDFDGKPESIRTFRNGRLAMVERDPKERGVIDIVEFYDDSGKLIRREVRNK